MRKDAKSPQTCAYKDTTPSIHHFTTTIQSKLTSGFTNMGGVEEKRYQSTWSTYTPSESQI